MKDNYQVIKLTSGEDIICDLKELRLMFLDPTDLIISKINRFLYSKKTIKFIFS